MTTIKGLVNRRWTSNNHYRNEWDRIFRRKPTTEEEKKDEEALKFSEENAEEKEGESSDSFGKLPPPI